MVIGLASSVKS